ncbi:MAG: hypothetical protein Q8P63_00850 [Candidatus Nealsonbacteria bacterium]|nr:hypothetical protein [Candidatus Nealsonbacteria bacterium]
MNTETKSWIGIAGIFIGLPILLWIFVVKAPLVVVFTWVIFIIGVPMFLEKLGKGGVVEFWKKILKNGIKLGACLFLFLLTRSYFTLMIGFTPFESWVNWSTSTGAATLLGYTPTKILFEAVFLLLIGYLLVIKAVFEEKPWASRIVLTFFFICCFLLQIFIFGAGAEATRLAKVPLEGKAMASAVGNYGAVGGTLIQLKTAAFGKGEPTPPRNISWMTTKVETEKNDLFRVYAGDTIYYYADKGFWVEYEDGNKYFNNPSYNGQMMKFVITSAKKEGEIVRVWSEKSFQLKYKVESHG